MSYSFQDQRSVSVAAWRRGSHYYHTLSTAAATAAAVASPPSPSLTESHPFLPLSTLTDAIQHDLRSGSCCGGGRPASSPALKEPSTAVLQRLEQLDASSGAAASSSLERRSKRGRDPLNPTEEDGRRGKPDSVEGDFVPSVSFVKGFSSVDHMGRVFITPLPAALQAAAPRMQLPCTVPRAPRRIIQSPHATARGEESTPSGIQVLRWAPPHFGHLLFSSDLSGVTKLWQSDAPKASPPIATFHSHQQPIKSLRVTSDAAVMSTGSTDGTLVVWDVESGTCLHRIAPKAEHGGAGDAVSISAHLHHPSHERHLLLAAVNRRVLLFDLRDRPYKPQRAYEGHMGSVLHLSLLDADGSKLLTTSEDKTLRTWDFSIPIQIKQFADAGMPAITDVVEHPVQTDLLAAQSLNNTVLVFQNEGGGRLRLCHHREFSGHRITGTRCQLGFSRDGVFLSSGDVFGGLHIWRWATREPVRQFTAHSAMLTSHLWHPVEPSRVVTGGWDGAIKEWR